MSEKNLFHSSFFVVILLLVVLSASACQPQPVATPLPPLPTVLATATSAVKATVPPTAAPKAAVTAAPKPKVVRTVDDITKTIATSQFLDGKHQAKGLACDACHTAMPPKGAPEMSVCLKCHLGTMTALAEKTDKVQPNPHKSHMEVESCAECHTGHGAFVYGCGQAGCHTEYSNNRFK